jgi:rubrerythrin
MRKAMRVALPRLRCPYCSHIWIPRKTEIRICPNCKNSLKRFSLEELLLPVKPE